MRAFDNNDADLITRHACVACRVFPVFRRLSDFVTDSRQQICRFRTSTP
jgi:hypothetical protein